MANGQDDSQQPREVPASVKKPASSVGTGLTDLGKAIETLFGPAPAAPTSQPGMPQTAGGTRSIAGPMPSMSSAGATVPGGLPAAPQRQQDAPMQQPGVLSTGTPLSAGGATVAGGMSNVFGALHDLEQNKKKDDIQHAEFLYNLVKTAYENGDETTANTILGDPKNRKKIEKYLTGNLPRVPGKPTETLPATVPGGPPMTNMPMQGKDPVGKINEPGGVALPRPGAQQNIQAMIANLLQQRMSQGDPRAVGALAGGEQVLSPEEYQAANRQKFGIDLTPQQVAILDANTRDTLITAKADVLKYVVGKTATAETALATAKIHAGATVAAAATQANARLKIAKDYRSFLLKIKGTAPDQIEKATYSGMMKLYTDMATTSQKSAEELLKAGKTKEAQPFLQEAKDNTAKAEGMRAQYEAGQFLDKILSGGDTGENADPVVKDDTPDSKDDDK